MDKVNNADRISFLNPAKQLMQNAGLVGAAMFNISGQVNAAVEQPVASSANSTPAVVQSSKENPFGLAEVANLLNGKTKAEIAEIAKTPAMIKLVVDPKCRELASALYAAAPVIKEQGAVEGKIIAGANQSPKKEVAPIGETKEQEKERKERERLAKLSTKLLEEFNAGVMKNSSWPSSKIGPDKIDSEVSVKNNSGGLKFTMSKKNGTLGRATYHKNLAAGKYNVDLGASEGKIMIWWEGGKGIFLTPGPNTFELPVGTGIDLCVFVNQLHPEVELNKFTISPAEEVKAIAGQ